MTLFILVNFGLFISILLKVFCRTDNAEVVVNKSAPTKQVDLRWLMVLILIFNFGIPWLLYVFYINEMLSFYFTYIFIIFNGSQVRLSSSLSPSSCGLIIIIIHHRA